MAKAGTPRWLKPMNRVLTLLQRTGLGAKWLHVLVLPGRRTGKLRRTPVSVLDLDDRRYLLAGFPGADWAANARAAGVGILSVGRRDERVRLVELSPADAELLESLRTWRLGAAAGKPAYTVANNRTLEAIAASRPGDEAALATIHGVGPAFIERHAEAVLSLVAAA
jgi:superfamily II DNA helicase RecQ